MPRDHSGQPLRVGDKVLIPCTITSVCEDDDYTNLCMETDHAMLPGLRLKVTIALNSNQVDRIPESKTLANESHHGLD